MNDYELSNMITYNSQNKNDKLQTPVSRGDLDHNKWNPTGPVSVSIPECKCAANLQLHIIKPTINWDCLNRFDWRAVPPNLAY